LKAELANGIIVEGTPEELATLIRELAKTPTENGRSFERSSLDPVTTQADWRGVNARALWNTLSSDQRKLLVSLKGGNRVQLNDLRIALGKEDGIDVAGLLAGITRHVRRETGNSEAKLVETLRDEHNNKCYQLAPEILELLREFIS